MAPLLADINQAANLNRCFLYIVVFFIDIEHLHFKIFLVQATVGEKIFMRSRFHDFSFIENDDAVCILDGGQSMRDDECGSMLHDFKNARLVNCG